MWLCGVAAVDFCCRPDRVHFVAFCCIALLLCHPDRMHLVAFCCIALLLCLKFCRGRRARVDNVLKPYICLHFSFGRHLVIRKRRQQSISSLKTHLSGYLRLSKWNKCNLRATFSQPRLSPRCWWPRSFPHRAKNFPGKIGLK